MLLINKDAIFYALEQITKALKYGYYKENGTVSEGNRINLEFVKPEDIRLTFKAIKDSSFKGEFIGTYKGLDIYDIIYNLDESWFTSLKSAVIHYRIMLENEKGQNNWYTKMLKNTIEYYEKEMGDELND